MLLTLGTLAELKAHLLTESLRASTDYDAAIEALGKGVAGLFEKRCNRKFYRTAADTFDFAAERVMVVLPRYPLEAITKVELRETIALGYVDQGTVSDVIENFSEASGLVFLSVRLGDWQQRVRLTYTGGYWFPDTPEGEEAAETLPTGATERPADLYHAWLTQCEYIWKIRDKLGISIAQGNDAGGALLGLSIAGVQLLPLVNDTLNGYVNRSLV